MGKCSVFAYLMASWAIVGCGAGDSSATDDAGSGGTDGNGSGGTVSGGSGGSESDGNGGSDSGDCPPECFRPYTCATACGEPEINNGCCPCPEDMIDTISCPDISVETGVWGEVLWLEGNHQPGAGTGTSMPISREVRVYEVVTMNDAVEAADRPDAYSVYDSISGTLVDSTTSDDQGFYEIELSAGTYSVFVEDEGDWYCNSFNADGMCVVEVSEGETVEFNIRIDYAAAY